MNLSSQAPHPARRALRTAATIFLSLLACTAVIGIALHLSGSAEDWSSFLRERSRYLAIGRWSIYGITICGWCWMRARVLRREPFPETRVRLRRIETAALITIMALEGTLLWQATS